MERIGNYIVAYYTPSGVYGYGAAFDEGMQARREAQ